MTSIGEEVQNISVNIIPWLFILIIIIVIAAIAILLQGKKVQKKKLMASSKKYTVQVGDTLPSIAKKAGVNWEKLADINKNEIPYELTPNQQLLIPPK